MPDALQWLWPVVSAVSGAVGAYLAIRTELAWLREDVNRAHRRIDEFASRRV